MIEERSRRVRSSLLNWCTEYLSQFGEAPARHHRLIIHHLELVCQGRIDRLMILAPPGSAKSTYATKLFAPYWFVRHPRSAVISASHTSDLADSFGREVRNIVLANTESLGFDLSEDSRSAGFWHTTQGGVYMAAGVGKAIAGRRADLAIIDDPVKSREAAESELERETTWRWYRGDLYNRLKPRARIVLIQTRWHEDDLGGRLLLEQAEGRGDGWVVLSLPAVCDSRDDLLGRAIGEALWPEWESLEALQRKRRAIGEREWFAQFQQQPRPDDGSIFQTRNIQVWDSVQRVESERAIVPLHSMPTRLGRPLQTRVAGPEMLPRVVRAWDFSSTAKTGTRDPDWTVGVLMERLPRGVWLIHHVARMRGSPQDVEAFVLRTAADDRAMFPDHTIRLAQDPGSAGKMVIDYYVRMLAGYRVRWKTMAGQGKKAVRAAPLASQVESGSVAIMAGPWVRPFLDELAAFPAGTHDDQVDAAVDAFDEMLPPTEHQVAEAQRRSRGHVRPYIMRR